MERAIGHPQLAVSHPEQSPFATLSLYPVEQESRRGWDAQICWGAKVIQHRECINNLFDLGSWPNSPLQIHYETLARSSTPDASTPNPLNRTASFYPPSIDLRMPSSEALA
jgi:hypothetical protein